MAKRKSLLFLFLKILLPTLLVGDFLSFLEKTSSTTQYFIESNGYPFEEHQVTTEDGYIVTAFRIPHPTNSNQDNLDFKKPRPVAFIMHGYSETSCNWVMLGAPRALSFYLVEHGYDVWLGNARGTRYSQKHVKLSPEEPKFWNFSWHEIGIYDTPAFIHYILKKTSVEKIHYIGHSQGTTVLLVAASTVPGFNEYIKTVHLLAPIAFMANVQSLLFQFGGLILGHPHPLNGLVESAPLRGSTRLSEEEKNFLCQEKSLIKDLCYVITYDIFGWNSKWTNMSGLRLYLDVTPAGGSTNQLIHYTQLYNSKKFHQYDFGTAQNLRIYQQAEPLDYNLTAITAPLYIYHSENDALADPKDVKHLLKALPSDCIRKNYKMPFKSWNHIDFQIANNVDEILFSMILEDIRGA